MGRSAPFWHSDVATLAMARARAFAEECGADVLIEISKANSFSFFQFSNKETETGRS